MTFCPVPKKKYTKERFFKPKKVKNPKISELKKELDFIFSWWIRLKECTASGFNRCFTCGKITKVIELQAGHYWLRKNGILRFDERNVKPQCPNCNCSIFGGGRFQQFALGLEKEYGGTILQDLEDTKRKQFQYKWYEIQEEINVYKALVKGRLLKFPEIKVSKKLEQYLKYA